MFGPNLRYKCMRCGRQNLLTSPQFAALPRMTAEEIAAKTCDMPWTKPEEVPMLPVPEKLSEEPEPEPSPTPSPKPGPKSRRRPS